MADITQNGVLQRDDNDYPVMGGTSSSDDATIINSAFDPITRRLLTDASGGGSGTVTSFSFNDANGFDGTVTNPTTTPELTLTTTITNGALIKSNSGALAAAVAGTDYTSLAFKTIAVSGQSDVVADSPEDTLTLAAGTGITITTNAGTDTVTITNSGSGGDVVGPGSATDNAIARFDGTTGKLIQNSTVIVADTTGNMSGFQVLTFSGSSSGTTALQASAAAGTTTITMPAATDTMAVLAASQAFTNKSYNGMTLTSTTGTFTLASGKTLTQSNTLTYTGTDGSTVNFGAGGTVLYTASTIPLTVGSTTIASGTTTRILYDNAGVLGEYTLTGSGTVVAMQTAPSFLTSITTPSVLASSNDSGALGASGTAFADLFLASGGVINWAAGDYTLTHSTGILTANKDFRITSANVGTNADSVPTLSSTSTLTNKTLTSPTIQTAPVLATGSTFKFTVPTADTTGTGITTNEFNSGYSSTAVGELVYLDSSATWQKADADGAAALYSSMLGIALTVASSGNPVTVLLQGFVYAASQFPTFTIGAPVYMSATAGAVTNTAPTTTDSATRIVGYGVHADKMWFNPSNDWITHT